MKKNLEITKPRFASPLALRYIEVPRQWVPGKEKGARKATRGWWRGSLPQVEAEKWTSQSSSYMFLLDWFSRFQSFKQRRFWATHVNRNWPFFIFGIAQIFSQIVSIRVKKLCNTNFISSRHIKRENALLPVDVRRLKTPLLKLPSSLRSIALLVRRTKDSETATDKTAPCYTGSSDGWGSQTVQAQ